MIITRTPYRVSLAGGGTDFPDFFRAHGGLAISAALGKHFYIGITPRLDDNINLSYTRVEFVPSAGDLQHEYARTVLERYGLHTGLEIGMMGEVPGGSGLGSSSAVTVGLLHAVRTWLNLESTAELLAREAVYIETELLQKPIGWQDQYGVAFPALKLIRFNPNSAVSVEPLALTPDAQAELEKHALLVRVGHPRRAEAILLEQSSNADDNQSGLATIRSIADDMLAVLRRTPLDLPRLGALLSESWQIKRTLAAGVADAEIDAMYAAGIAAGALGGKLLGAGGGGFMLFLIPPEKQAAMLARMGNPIALPLTLDPAGSQVVYDSRQ